MRIGFALPQFGALAHQPDQVARFARRIEELGGDSLWVADRLLAPVDPTVGYAGGSTIPREFRSVLDPFTLLTVATTATGNVRLGTNVLNAPWYPPALLARTLTSIDALSGGRLVPGFGTGWSPEEFAAAGVPMAERGARLDECLDALHQLWTADPAEHRGSHWSVPATHSHLKPAQDPHPPIYLAGFAEPALRRVARRADGWLPVWRPGTGAFDPAAHLAEPLARVRSLAEEAGRDPRSLTALLRVYPTEAGTVDEVVDAIVRADRDAGVDDAFVDLMCLAEDVDHALELAGEILRRARG
jgi:probable F420-dependent oxidoreductase